MNRRDWRQNKPNKHLCLPQTQEEVANWARRYIDGKPITADDITLAHDSVRYEHLEITNYGTFEVGHRFYNRRGHLAALVVLVHNNGSIDIRHESQGRGFTHTNLPAGSNVLLAVPSVSSPPRFEMGQAVRVFGATEISHIVVTPGTAGPNEYGIRTVGNENIQYVTEDWLINNTAPLPAEWANLEYAIGDRFDSGGARIWEIIDKNPGEDHLYLLSELDGSNTIRIRHSELADQSFRFVYNHNGPQDEA